MEIKDVLEKLKRNDISSAEAKLQIQQILSNKKKDFNTGDGLSLSHNFSIEDVHRYVLEITAAVLKLETYQISLNEPLDSYGIDSIMAVRLANAFEGDLGTLSKMLIFEYNNLEELSQYFYQTFPEQIKARKAKEIRTPKIPSPLLTLPPAEQEIPSIQQPFVSHISNDESNDIAIIGMSGKYPKSPDLEIFWENLKAGFNGIDGIPPERWDYREFYDSQKSRQGTMCTHSGGFIEGVDEFDHLLFEISPSEAKILDPQDRLFLQSVWESLEDAGYTRESIVKKTKGEVGVYVGIMTSDYSLLSARNVGKETNVFSNGISAEVANRTSYFFDFQGPSITLNTMCSSSLTALSLAYDSLKQKRIRLAIVGGVNLSLHPNKFLILSDNHFLSKDGFCRSFGSGGDGYIPSEGCGSVILKPLKQALEDRDHIYGVIKSAAVNNSGRSNRYRFPMVKAQAKVVNQALTEANIHPRTMSYIEAHGTGTQVGDLIEIDGLNQVFSKMTVDKQFCSIGSVKSNMGHSEGAAGIASVTKVLLQMQHKTLVPSIHSQIPNSNIQFEKTPFFIQQRCEPWKKMILFEEGKEKMYPRRAGVSSFGAGGTNVHIILEEYEQRPLSFNRSPLQDLFVLSAASRKQLKQYVLKMIRFLMKRQSHPEYVSEVDFQARFSYTLQVGRESMQCRLAIDFSDLDQLVEILTSFASDVDINQYVYGEIDKKQAYVDPLYNIHDFSLETLKNDWILGKTIPWESLWSSQPPLRIGLPTYPFEKRKFWISDDLPTFSGKIYDSSIDLKKSQEPLLFAVPVWTKKNIPQKQEQFNQLEKIGEKILLYPSSYHSKISSIQLAGIREVIELPTYHSGDDVVKGLHFISAFIQKIMKEKRYAHATFLVLLEESDYWKYAYLKGFFLSLIQEQPKFQMKIVLLPSIGKMDVNSIIQKEWLSTEQIVHYHFHERFSLSYQSIQQDQKKHVLVAKEGGVYWITGGFGGLGRLFAIYFGKQSKNLTLILSGRSPVEEKQFESLKEIVGANINLIYEQCDVSQKKSVSDNVAKILHQYHKIDGIIHSAGVIRDSLLIRKNLDYLKDVVNPKVLGIINLDDATKDLPLDYFLFFSSESGAFGNGGQTDYAAANAFMDAFAMRRNQLRERGLRSGKTLSINWPLWKEGGMRVTNHVEKEIFDLTGIVPLESNNGTQSLDFMLSVEASQIFIAQGNTEKIKEFYHILPHFSENVEVHSFKSIGDEDLLRDEQLSSKTDSDTAKKSTCINQLRQMISKMTSLPCEEINFSLPLNQLALGNFEFVALQRELEAYFLTPIPFTLFRNHGNLAELAQKLDQMAFERKSDELKEGLTSNLEIDQMSDEEAKACLIKELY